MIKSIKPVRIGILIGLLGIVLGIGWALYLVLGHESIHQTLEAQGAKAGQDADVKAEGRGAEKMGMEIMSEKKAHPHMDASQHGHSHHPLTPPQGKEAGSMGGQHHGPSDSSHEENKGDESMSMQEMQGGHHNNPVMSLAHTRLVRGHLHAMGLGLVTITVSLLLAFTTIGETIKTVASVLTGLGGIIYPIAWVVMGYLTPALGPDGAQASVIYIAGPGVVFVLFGVFTVIFSISRDILKNKD